MDYITLVSSVQRDKNISDSDMAKLTGINEYTYYALKKYRVYLSKVAYYSISCVLGLPIAKDSEIEDILLENKEKVGSPESNLTIAAECVNPDYLDKMEKELNRLKKIADVVDEKNKVISNQFIEIERLRKELESEWSDLNRKVQEAYSNGVKEGASKVEIMKASETQRMMMSLNAEYTDRIDRLEKGLARFEKLYNSLYKAVYLYNQNSFDNGVDLSSFEMPIPFLKEKVGIVISDELKIQVLTLYHNMTMSVSDIVEETSLSRKDVENIIKSYTLKKVKNGFILEELV